MALFLTGFWVSIPAMQLAGVIMLGHSSADRVLGYGLKYPDAFQHTHLGWIGRRNTQSSWEGNNSDEVAVKTPTRPQGMPIPVEQTPNRVG